MTTLLRDPIGTEDPQRDEPVGRRAVVLAVVLIVLLFAAAAALRSQAPAPAVLAPEAGVELGADAASDNGVPVPGGPEVLERSAVTEPPDAASLSSLPAEPGARAAAEHARQTQDARPEPLRTAEVEVAAGRPGDGRGAVALPLDGGLTPLHLTHAGEGPYRFAATDAEGRLLTVLAEGHGPLDTTVALRAPEGMARVEVYAEAAWTVDLADLPQQQLPAVLRGSATGIGGPVELLGGTVRVDVEGAERPVVTLLAVDGSARHVARPMRNGAHVAAVPTGAYLVQIETDGPWQATVTQASAR